MDIIWLILSLIRAAKENNFELHLTTLYELCSLFFTYNHHNYSRYIPEYLVTMLNLSDTHPGAEELLKSNGFSVSRSTVPLSLLNKLSTVMPNHMVALLASVEIVLRTTDGASQDILEPNM